ADDEFHSLAWMMYSPPPTEMVPWPLQVVVSAPAGCAPSRSGATRAAVAAAIASFRMMDPSPKADRIWERSQRVRRTVALDIRGGQYRVIPAEARAPPTVNSSSPIAGVLPPCCDP